jgi:hypothetical protein
VSPVVSDCWLLLRWPKRAPALYHDPWGREFFSLKK